MRYKDLRIDETLIIIKTQIKTCIFGDATLLELPEFAVFLQSRVTDAFHSLVENYEPSQYTVRFTGLEECGKYNPAVTFLIEEFDKVFGKNHFITLEFSICIILF